MYEAVGELVHAMMVQNDVTDDDVVSLILTSTPDLTCAFPAAGARAFGLVDVPLLCAQEIDVVGGLAKVVRILMHVESTKSRAQLRHVYLRGAEVLRQDLKHTS
jgi:chorismate mutase